MLSGVQGANEMLLALLVFHETLTFTFSDDEKVECSFALLNFDFFWLRHDKFNLCDNVVFNFLIKCEDQVLFELLREDKPRHFLLERGTDHAEKLTQLVLVVERLLDVL